MSELHRSVVSLRFFGDDVDPDEITAVLGAEPTSVWRKGCRWRLPNGKESARPARTNAWSLEGVERHPADGDLDGQITELLAPLSDDLHAWQNLTSRCRADIFCGLFMQEWNEGMSLSPKTLFDLGSRGLLLDLDIYGPKTWDCADEK